jgi:hypothetical protein
MDNNNEKEAWFTKQPGGLTVHPANINGWLVVLAFIAALGLIIKMEESNILSNTTGTLTAVLVGIIFTTICFQKSE